MAVCTIDNTATWRRECWQDGKLICSYAAKLFDIKPFPIPPHLFFFGANIGDWKPGQIWGDPKAMEQQRHGAGE